MITYYDWIQNINRDIKGYQESLSGKKIKIKSVFVKLYLQIETRSSIKNNKFPNDTISLQILSIFY